MNPQKRLNRSICRLGWAAENHVLDGMHIGATWRVRWNDLRGDSDAGRRYHYCDDLFVMVLRIRLKRRSVRFSCSLGLYMDVFMVPYRFTAVYSVVLLDGPGAKRLERFPQNNRSIIYYVQPCSRWGLLAALSDQHSSCRNTAAVFSRLSIPRCRNHCAELPLLWNIDYRPLRAGWHDWSFQNHSQSTTHGYHHIYHHHHLFAQYAEMNSKICNVPDRKANSFSSNNCP